MIFKRRRELTCYTKTNWMTIFYSLSQRLSAIKVQGRVCPECLTERFGKSISSCTKFEVLTENTYEVWCILETAH